MSDVQVETGTIQSLMLDKLEDSPIKKLYEEFLGMCGVLPTEELTLHIGIGFDEVGPKARSVETKGLSMWSDVDDWSDALFRDGKPIGSLYISTRGHMYQAGMVVSGMDGTKDLPAFPDLFFFASNVDIPGIPTDGYDTWTSTERSAVVVQVAYDWLMGKALLTDQEQKEHSKEFFTRMDKALDLPPGTFEKTLKEAKKGFEMLQVLRNRGKKEN